MKDQFSSTVVLCYSAGFTLQSFDLIYGALTTTQCGPIVRLQKCQKKFTEEEKCDKAGFVFLHVCSVDMSGWSERKIQMWEEVGVTVKH